MIQKGVAVERLEPKFHLSKYRVNEQNIKNAVFSIYPLWKITKIISDGTHFTPKYMEQGVKFLSVKDVRDFEINYSNSKFISEEEANILDKRCKPQRNDILLTKIGTTGLASVINSDERFQIFVSVALLRPNISLILPDFLNLCLNSNLIRLQFERVIKGAGVPDLHLEDIRKVKTPVPPLKIQAEIIEKFETAYTAKKQKEAEATALLASIDGYLLQELGITLPPPSEKKTFFYTPANKVSGGRFDANTYSENRSSAIKAVESCKYPIKKLKFVAKFLKSIVSESSTLPYLGLENIESNTGNLINTLEKQSFGSAILFSKNKVLFPKLRPYLNKVYLTDFDGVCSTEFHVIDSKIEELTNVFLANFLISQLVVSQTKCLMSGNTLPRLQTEDIENLLIPLPPPEKQTEIANHISALRTQAKQLQQQATVELEQAKQQVEQMILGE